MNTNLLRTKMEIVILKEVNNMKNTNKFIDENSENNELIERLSCNKALTTQLMHSFVSNSDEGIPQWVYTAGYVIDVLKWVKNEQADEIIDELQQAAVYQILSPYAEDINQMWDSWNNNESYHPEAKTIEDILKIILDYIEENAIEDIKEIFSILSIIDVE